jgi:hypothetical protein
VKEKLQRSSPIEAPIDEPDGGDVARATESLIRFYGEDALSRARLIEQRLPSSLFAQRVREQMQRYVNRKKI